MKKQFGYTLAYFSIILILLTACQKEEEVAPPTKAEILSSSPWVFQSATAGGTDVSNNVALACIKDNTLTFTKTGGYTVTEGTIVCSPTTAGTFTLNFQTNDTQLILSSPLFPGGNGTCDIITLNETNLVVSQNVTIPPSLTPIQVVFTFKH
jgi:hypothetical protein